MLHHSPVTEKFHLAAARIEPCTTGSRRQHPRRLAITYKTCMYISVICSFTEAFYVKTYQNCVTWKGSKLYKFLVFIQLISGIIVIIVFIVTHLLQLAGRRVLSPRVCEAAHLHATRQHGRWGVRGRGTRRPHVVSCSSYTRSLFFHN